MRRNYIIFLLLSIHILNFVDNSKIAGTLKSKNQNNNSNKAENKIETKLQTKSTNLLTLTTKLCNHLCEECSSNDLNYCTECLPGIIKFNFSCISKCPDGLYYDHNARTCNRCHPQCPICWGPNTNMCGIIEGLNSFVVLIEDEIKNFLMNYTFTQNEIDKWLKGLKIILNTNDDKIITDDNLRDLSSDEIYNTKNTKTDLPIGSFSQMGGIFIPVPSYMSFNKKLVNSHWVFKKGQWDGQRWVNQNFPRLPSFIRYYGQKNKIYKEYQGYWLYDENKSWIYLKEENFSEFSGTVSDILSILDNIKIDVNLFKYLVRRL